MTNFNKWKKNQITQSLSIRANIIEKTLASYGVKTRVVRIDRQKESLLFSLQVVIGTKIDEIENRQRELALALASPTGKVDIQAPIPGSSFIGIKLPYVEVDENLFQNKRKRKFLGHILVFLGDISLFAGYVFTYLGRQLYKISS